MELEAVSVEQKQPADLTHDNFFFFFFQSFISYEFITLD